MDKLIVDDNPIFTRVLKKCLWCAVFQFDLNTQNLCLKKLACMTFENLKVCSVAMQTKRKPNKQLSALKGPIYIYGICPLA